MRGEKIKVSGSIVDKKGATRYYIIPANLLVFGLMSMGLLIVVAILLGVMVLTNRTDIDNLRDRLKIEKNK